MDSLKPRAWDGFEAEYAKLKQKLEKVTDLLGSHIEEGILDTVIYLNMLGFPTAQSCEAHDDGTGSPIPWVTIKQPNQPEYIAGEQAEYKRLMDEMGIQQKDLTGPDMNDDIEDAHSKRMEEWYDAEDRPVTEEYELWRQWSGVNGERLKEWMIEFNASLPAQDPIRIRVESGAAGQFVITASEAEFTDGEKQYYRDLHEEKRTELDPRMQALCHARQQRMKEFTDFLREALKKEGGGVTREPSST